MNLVVIFLAIVVIILLYFLYVYYYDTTSKLSATAHLKKPPAAITMDSLINGESTRYSYSVWIYVNTWTSENTKRLISRSSSASNNGTEFSLYLDATSPKLSCFIKSQDSTPNTPIVVTSNFPIQKWTYVIISVDNQIVDLYLDGKLVVSKKLESMPLVSKNSIELGDSTKQDIYLADLVRLAKPMDPQTAWNNYLNGNGYANNSKYNINLTLLQDSTELKKYSIF